MQPLSVLLVDVDRFKMVNDRHGHLAGDHLLAHIAEQIRSRLRAHDFVARYGGDEFLILLPQTPHEEAEHVAEELRALVASTELTEPGRCSVVDQQTPAALDHTDGRVPGRRHAVIELVEQQVRRRRCVVERVGGGVADQVGGGDHVRPIGRLVHLEPGRDRAGSRTRR